MRQPSHVCHKKMEGETRCQKNEEPVRIPRLSWRMPSMAMTIRNNNYNQNNDDKDGDNDSGGAMLTGQQKRVVGFKPEVELTGCAWYHRRITGKLLASCTTGRRERCGVRAAIQQPASVIEAR